MSKDSPNASALPGVERPPAPPQLSVSSSGGRREQLVKAHTLQRSIDDGANTAAASATAAAASKAAAAASKAAAPQKSQPADPIKGINIGVASRALFNIESDISSYDDDGQLQAYISSQLSHESEPFPPGSAFPFIQALETVNGCLRKINPAEQELFNIVLMSHNHAQLGVRIINSINHHNLNIERMCLTGGSSPVPDYLAAYNISLFLTSFPEEVALALQYGFAAAAMSRQKVEEPIKNELRVAFGLDAVLFAADCSEYPDDDAAPFTARPYAPEYDEALTDTPVEEGPLKNFAAALGRMQAKLRRGRAIIHKSPLRIYIVTSRGASRAGERAIKTLRSWGLDVDEIHFLAGADKGPVLRAIKPHLFFDDRHAHIRSAVELGLPGAHVPACSSSANLQEKFRAAFWCRSPATPRSRSPVDEGAGDGYLHPAGN